VNYRPLPSGSGELSSPPPRGGAGEGDAARLGRYQLVLLDWLITIGAIGVVRR